MGRLNINVRDDVERRFRDNVYRRKGMRKGNLTQAVEEAMLMWVSSADEGEEKANKSK